MSADAHGLSLSIEAGIAIVSFDLPGEPINKFSAAVIAGFDEVLSELERNAAVKAAVLISGKPDGFIAGADIDAFLAFRNEQDATAASAMGNRMMWRLERARVPMVAAIHGACLGGGLEAALACAYRVATDHPRTVFAFPEVQLGLIPGAGGTQRLPRAVGLQAALDMILTARNVRAKKALQLGLVEELVHPAILRDVALERARQLATGARSRARETRGGVGALLIDRNPVGRSLVLNYARHRTLDRTHGNFPAPIAAISAVAAGYHGTGHGAAEEARLFGEMAVTAACRELIFLFYATTSLKKESGVEGEAPPPLPVGKIGVLGAGFMGAGIASVAAMQGVPVRFKDTKHEQVARGLSAARDVLTERLTRRQITRRQMDDQLSLISGTVEYTGFGNATLVVEAVFEEVSVKRQVLEEVEPVLPANAIFATNTSTIPIRQIAEAAKRPERVIGMHFFSPVHKMPLLEVIVTPRTARDVIVTTVAFGRTLGKTVIVVNDSPGFFANRILAPYLNEAGRLLDEGVAVDAIDRAMVDFGFPVGPITLLDEVGLDIADKSGAILAAAFGDRLRPSDAMARMLAAGRRGRKGRQGFYRYDGHGRKGGVDETVYEFLATGTPRTQIPKEEIQRRCALAMVNEAVRCLEEGIIRHPRDGDVGAVFGIGFPPFRGGPFRFVDATGASAVVQQLQRLDATHHGRFTPSAMLGRMADAQARFYPASGRPV
jgi:3-hydroxyacyl-CoA dehydrogenase/enoyl-CoA hydratase/3-hydroxybutyryl-CoA epimerase